MKTAQQIIRQRNRDAAQAMLIGIVGAFVLVAIFGACLAWDRQLEKQAKDCQEACVQW